MKDPIRQVQQALYDRISGGTYAVYDWTPSDFPDQFIEIVFEDSVNESAKGCPRTTLLIELHCWTTDRSNIYVSDMYNYIGTMLTFNESCVYNPLVMEDFNVVLIKRVSTDVNKVRVKDKFYYQGVMEIEILVQENAC